MEKAEVNDSLLLMYFEDKYHKNQMTKWLNHNHNHTLIYNINQINSLLSDESYLSNDLNAVRSVNTLYPLPLYSTLVSVGNETVWLLFTIYYWL